MKSLETAIAVLDAASSIANALGFAAAVPGLGVAIAVLQIIMIFMPKQPSAEELAIEAAVETIT